MLDRMPQLIALVLVPVGLMMAFYGIFIYFWRMWCAAYLAASISHAVDICLPSTLHWAHQRRILSAARRGHHRP